mmetsp:Transcript_24025/g.42676  ORF Transcript_24025/g.42676 Transcript_24025/m.42676 type:complete len:437 (-) Transcript_24025:3-1313(-)
MDVEFALETSPHRLLRTLKSFRPGDAVVTASAQLVVVLPSEKTNRCHVCLKLGEFPACRSCNYVRFCSAECRQALSTHNRECSFIADSYMSATMILAVRLVNHPLFSKFNLQANPDEAPHARQTEWTQNASRLHRLTEQVISTKDFVRIFALINTNASFLCDEDFHSYGLGLFFPNCYVNHSCWPNCVAIYQDAVQKYCALREIRPGEEITIAYCDIIESKAKRRKTLNQNFYFLCECQRCREPLVVDYYSECMACDKCEGGISLEEEDALSCNICGRTADYNKLESLAKRQRGYEERIASLVSGGDANALRKVMKTSGLHPLHSFWIEFCSKAIPLLEETRLYKHASQLSKQFSHIATMVYPPNYPPVAIEYYRTGRLMIFADNRTEALEFLKAARDILSLFYRKEDSEFLKHIAETVEGLEYEAQTGQRVLNFN